MGEGIILRILSMMPLGMMALMPFGMMGTPGVVGAQIGVLELTNQVSLAGLLKSHDSRNEHVLD